MNKEEQETFNKIMVEYNKILYLINLRNFYRKPHDYKVRLIERLENLEKEATLYIKKQECSNINQIEINEGIKKENINQIEINEGIKKD